LETERSQKKQDLVIVMAFQSISFALGPNVALLVTRNEKGTLALLGTHFCGAKFPVLCTSLKLTASIRMFAEQLTKFFNKTTHFLL
jgi:hypothetical protein